MRLRFATLLAAPVLAGALTFVACSGEGEGQPCDTNAGNLGNDDCQSGLTCQSVSNSNSHVCCPPDRSQATTPECTLPNGGVGDASPAPPDSGRDTATTTDAADGAPGDGATSDAPGDGTSDAPSADAPPDAPGEGGADASDGGRQKG